MAKRLKEIKTEYFHALRVGWFLAVRQIKHAGRGTTALIVFIMILTFLNLVVVSGLLLGLIVGSFEQFRENYSGNVLITTASGREYIENSPALISFLNQDPKVKAISARHSMGAQILGTLDSLPEKNESPNRIGIGLAAIDPEKEVRLTGFDKSIKYGEMLEPGESGYILIGANMIKKYSAFADANFPGLVLLENVDVGSRVRMTLTKKGGETISKDFIIKGILKSKVDQVSTRAFISDTEYRRLLPVNNEQYQEIAIKTEPEDAPKLVGEIKEFIGADKARVQTSEEAIPSFLRDIETSMSILGNILSSIALVVASITIFIVIYINAVTKRKFIGIMKGIGISPRAIVFAYIFQALYYGIFGSIIGLILTFGFIKPYFDAYPIDFPFSDGIIVVTALGASTRILILLTVTFIAGYLPAKLIVRKNTLDAILGR